MRKSSSHIYKKERMKYMSFSCCENNFSPRAICCSKPASRKKDAKQVELNVATGGAGPLPILLTPLTNPINIVTTSIDTSDFCNESNNLLHFSAIINLPLAAVVTLNFEIVRVLDDGPAVVVGPAFTFATVAAVAQSVSFNFQYADLEAAPGDYTSSVRLATTSAVTVTAGTTILNATLSVLAVED
jgi:hypothetical protein